MTAIIGIDFSGAKSDRNTWVAQGRLTQEGSLELDSVEMTPRRDVLRLLRSVDTPAVAAIDFPFGVPRAFAEFVFTEFVNHGAGIQSMPDVWRNLAALSLEEFIGARDRFVGRFGEVKRRGDERHFSESFSPLHKANPNMLPMTYHGIRMLHELHKSPDGRWIVPPLYSADEAGKAVTLLESMPGAFLKAIGFEYAVYKRYKKARNALTNRRSILDGIAAKSGVALPNLHTLREACLASDDCLDSVVAAVAAVCWAQNSAGFRHPIEDELAAAELEGWIYVPQSAE